MDRCSVIFYLFMLNNEIAHFTVQFLSFIAHFIVHF